MKRALAIVGLCGLLLALAGCGTSQDAAGRWVLYAGVSHLTSRRHVVSDAEAKHDVKLQRRSWGALVASYRGGRRPVALSQHQFRQRLAAAAAQYGFTVKRLHFVHSRTLAPLVVIETRQYLALAQSIHLFINSLEPQTGAAAGRTPPELMFLEAQDERGVPFFAFGTGQWARSEELYPYAHG